MAASGSGQVSVSGPSIIKATVEIKAFREDAIIPKKATESAAGYDLCAWLKDSYDEQTLIAPHSTLIVPTGLNVNIPNGYEIQIRPRSGLAAKFGVTVLNTPGTIDSDYCGDGGAGGDDPSDLGAGDARNPRSPRPDHGTHRR